MDHSRLTSAILILCIIAYESAHRSSEAKRFLILSCGSRELNAEGKCDQIIGVGDDLELLINTSTQKVQVTQNSSPPIMLSDCNVVDVDNWDCKKNITITRDGVPELIKYVMHRGHLTESFVGHPPNFYESSVSGWRRFAVQYNILTTKQAQSFE